MRQLQLLCIVLHLTTSLCSAVNDGNKYINSCTLALCQRGTMELYKAMSLKLIMKLSLTELTWLCNKVEPAV